MPAVPKPKKRKKNPLLKQLDELAGTIIRSRGACEHCGRRVQLQWCHIVTRGAKSIRWELENAMCLCHSCHFMFTNNPEKWPVFVDDKLGDGHYMSLMRRANQYLKVDHKDKLAVLQAFADKHNIKL